MVSDRLGIKVLPCVLVLLWMLTGCASKDMIVKSMDPIMDDFNISVNRNPDVDTVRDAKDRQRASYLYLKARDYALRALCGGNAYHQFIGKPVDEFIESLGDLDRGDVPALYWSASCWMAWAALNIDKPQVLVDIPKIEAMLLKSVELDETYYFGGAHAGLGAYYASRAKSIGGDPDRARKHFDRAFEISGSRVLFFHLLYAQYYAYQVQDRELFQSTLQKVVDTPVDHFPEKNFANEVAKRKARALLEMTDEYF
jgi:tetratricopeptide (TPR) repeat protein